MVIKIFWMVRWDQSMLKSRIWIQFQTMLRCKDYGYDKCGHQRSTSHCQNVQQCVVMETGVFVNTRILTNKLIILIKSNNHNLILYPAK